MGYEVQMGGEVIGILQPDGTINYDKEKIKSRITEMVAGQQGGTKGKSSLGGMFSTIRVVYKWDRNRIANNNAVYALWKRNPIVQNRIRQLNALIFGRGFSYAYDEATKQIVDRFWQMNRFRSKLNPMGTDAQLFGEVFIALIPQKTGDVIMAIYESNQIQIDFNPANVDDIYAFLIAYKDEETNKEIIQKYMPIEKYLNEIEFADTPIKKAVNKVKKMLNGNGVSIPGYDGVMIHLKFNNSSAEVHGTSDFRQSFAVINDYMDFRADRMAIHQLYGSPMFDIEIDTDDEEVIINRINQLAGFAIGSNPVHNTKEKWTPLEFRHNADSAEHDEKAMRGLICAGTGFPEHLLFNQSDGKQDDQGTFALNKIAEDMQDSFGEAFKMMHKFVVHAAGGDLTKVDKGQIIFPEISTMSEKTKAETYVLKVGANICSRKTAAQNTGHDWNIEYTQMMEEQKDFGFNSDYAGIMGGRFSSRQNNQDPDRDDGSDDRRARANSRNISTQKMNSRKTND